MMPISVESQAPLSPPAYHCAQDRSKDALSFSCHWAYAAKAPEIWTRYKSTQSLTNTRAAMPSSLAIS